MDDDNTFSVRGHSEPDNSTPPVAASASALPGAQAPAGPLMFQLTVTQGPLDYLFNRYGVLPSDDLRLTVAQALHRQSTIWVDAVVQAALSSILSNN